MTEAPEKPSRADKGVKGLFPYVLLVGLIWLGWQVALVPLSARAPSEYAVRLAPGSPDVLSRAADDELRAGRHENAGELARLALSRAPFDVVALRVLGLAEEEAGRLDVADQLITLAGNWSLRDSVTHGWLVNTRLQQGNFASAFAHADTLARRRTGLSPELYNLFATAMDEDPRSVPYVAQLLSYRPPWRNTFIAALYRRQGGLVHAAQLAMVMKDSEGRFSDAELQDLYLNLSQAGLFPALRQVRTELESPPMDRLLMDGDFSSETAILPFGWTLSVDSGYSIAALPGSGPARPNAPEGSEAAGALMVRHAGNKAAVLAEQLLLLEPGRYQLRGQWRHEQGESNLRLVWQIRCAGAQEPLVSIPFVLDDPDPASTEWRSFEQGFAVPAEACSGQTLSLVSENPGRRSQTVTWFSQLDLVETP